MVTRREWRTALTTAGAVGALAVSACSTNDTHPTVPLPSASRSEARAGMAQFTPLPTSAACTVPGGNPTAPFVLPAGLGQRVFASEPQFDDDIDMNTQNETGAQRGRYLYRPSEMSSNGSVSVTDLVTNETKIIAKRADWERLDAAAWTPWGTLLTAEETNSARYRDPRYPDAKAGLVYELFFAHGDLTRVDSVVARPALGSKAHEGMRFDSDGNVYSISERNPGYIFKFVPDRKGDLSSGQLYALKIVQPTGDRTGKATWVALDRAAVRIDASAEGDRVGATGYNRPEDVEIALASEHDDDRPEVMYVAITGTGDNRVLAVELGRRHHDHDDTSHGRDEQHHGSVFVYDYVRVGLNATMDFSSPDNLALDHSGNLYIAEDPGGSFRNGAGKTTGDDIWMAPRAGKGQGRNPAKQIMRFASLTDCDAEPTGIYYDLNQDRLFVNVQHRGGDGLDKAVAIEPMRSGESD